MKKLNRKGFTLVELLAVIIILAIVVGITIPAITNIINDSKNNSLGVAVDAAEKYLSDQYSFMQLDAANVQSDFSTWINATTPTSGKYSATLTGGASGADKGIIEAMGFKLENVEEVKFTISATGVACVTVTKIPTTSEYYSTKYFNAPAKGTTYATPKTATDVPDYYSRSCTSVLS